jgi:hypothetical protein
MKNVPEDLTRTYVHFLLVTNFVLRKGEEEIELEMLFCPLSPPKFQKILVWAESLREDASQNVKDSKSERNKVERKG